LICAWLLPQQSKAIRHNWAVGDSFNRFMVRFLFWWKLGSTPEPRSTVFAARQAGLSDTNRLAGIQKELM
jgi:hypothetical protein